MKLPKQIYVSVEDSGTEDEYLNAQKQSSGHAEIGEKKKVGVYVLERTVVIEGTIEIKPA